MADEVSIFNLGLVQAGEDTLIDPKDEGGEGARAVRAVFPLMRDAVLRAHPWNFATHFATLSATGKSTQWEYANEFALPPDPYCLKVRDIRGRAKWEVAGRLLLTNAEAPLDIKMTRRVEDTELFDSLFTAALALRTASVVFPRLKRRQTDALRMWDLYKDVLREARSIDGQEQSAEEFDDGDFIRSRA